MILRDVQRLEIVVIVFDFGTVDDLVAHSEEDILKLTLDDGLEGRVIVSSIKQDYKPEELVGKKIIVIANLKPHRITGVTSQGMLLAGTNAACGCKLIFVDDSVPCGTCIK